MAEQGKPDLHIPPEMRAMAEQSVEQAKKAFDSVMTAAKGAVSGMEERAAAAQAGAKDMHRKAVAFAEHNVDASFEFARKMVAAKSAEEMVTLHADYVKSQMQALGEQVREIGQAASATFRPKD